MHKKTAVICGESDLKPDFEAIGNNPNFVFENDPNFESLRLFDFDGNLLGVNTSALRNDVFENVSYSIKSTLLSDMIDSLDEKITFTINNNLKNKSLKEQIKILSEFVVLIKAKVY